MSLLVDYHIYVLQFFSPICYACRFKKSRRVTLFFSDFPLYFFFLPHLCHVLLERRQVVAVEVLPHPLVVGPVGDALEAADLAQDRQGGLGQHGGRVVDHLRKEKQLHCDFCVVTRRFCAFLLLSCRGRVLNQSEKKICNATLS